MQYEGDNKSMMVFAEWEGIPDRFLNFPRMCYATPVRAETVQHSGIPHRTAQSSNFACRTELRYAVLCAQPLEHCTISHIILYHAVQCHAAPGRTILSRTIPDEMRRDETRRAETSIV